MVAVAVCAAGARTEWLVMAEREEAPTSENIDRMRAALSLAAEDDASR
jgi:hypothetical protein